MSYDSPSQVPDGIILGIPIQQLRCGKERLATQILGLDLYTVRLG